MMEFPVLLKEQIEALYDGIKQKDASQDSRQLSANYRSNQFDGAKLLQTEKQALAYAAVRMPATFGAICYAFEKIKEIYDFSPQSMIDVGAGTGACGWAAEKYFDLKELVCLEREKLMSALGQRFMKESDNALLRQATWLDFDLIRDDMPQKADLVTACYVLNELSDKDRVSAVLKLWQSVSQMLLIVEPGTPAAFKNMLQLREILLKNGAFVIAPCSHQSQCPLPTGDWCHFKARIARSRLHRQLKSAEMGYEDEKFCYMAFVRQPVSLSYKRILKEPQVSKPEVTCEVCGENGQVDVIKIPVRDKKKYKNAKKLRWGDILT